MADRAVTEERGAAADRLHRLRLLGSGIGDRNELSGRLAYDGSESDAAGVDEDGVLVDAE